MKSKHFHPDVSQPTPNIAIKTTFTLAIAGFTTAADDGKKHCAWEKGSPEAVYVLQLCGK